jgi:hypothetical protein
MAAELKQRDIYCAYYRRSEHSGQSGFWVEVNISISVVFNQIGCPKKRKQVRIRLRTGFPSDVCLQRRVTKRQQRALLCDCDEMKLMEL